MTRGAVPYSEVENWQISSYIQAGSRLAKPAYCPDIVYAVILLTKLDEEQSRTLARPAAPLAAYVQRHRCTTSLPYANAIYTVPSELSCRMIKIELVAMATSLEESKS